jgi:hypothetical protein
MPGAAPKLWLEGHGALLDQAQVQEHNLSRSKRAAKHGWRAAFLASFMLVAAGCETVRDYSLTGKLWDTDDFRRWSEPAPNPNLALFETQARDDVLAQYDAFSEKHSVVKRQAYQLRSNRARVAAGKKPALLDPAVPEGASPIPVLDQKLAGTNPPPQLPQYAVTANQGREFTLRRLAGPEETFQLPVYAETSGAFTRGVLTPFAVVGDTVMVGAVASVVGFIYWVGIGAPGYNDR